MGEHTWTRDSHATLVWVLYYFAGNSEDVKKKFKGELADAERAAINASGALRLNGMTAMPKALIVGGGIPGRLD
jgi:hypothetical protein